VRQQNKSLTQTPGPQHMPVGMKAPRRPRLTCLCGRQYQSRHTTAAGPCNWATQQIPLDPPSGVLQGAAAHTFDRRPMLGSRLPCQRQPRGSHRRGAVHAAPTLGAGVQATSSPHTMQHHVLLLLLLLLLMPLLLLAPTRALRPPAQTNRSMAQGTGQHTFHTHMALSQGDHPYWDPTSTTTTCAGTAQPCMPGGVRCIYSILLAATWSVCSVEAANRGDSTQHFQLCLPLFPSFPHSSPQHSTYDEPSCTLSAQGGLAHHTTCYTHMPLPTPPPRSQGKQVICRSALDL
jgi:hypothetical protein